jgi:hypothetical protein
MHCSKLMRVTSWGRALVALGAVPTVAALGPSMAWAEGPQPIPYPTAPVPVPYGAAPATPPPASVPLPHAPLPRTPPVGQDVIYLRNGGSLRGTLVDAIPDSQARIQLVTGEIATVPWAAIDRIDHGGPARPESLRTPAPLPAVAPGAQVWVHVEGADGAVLEVDPAGDGTWKTACRAPCDVEVPTAADYRIGGEGIRRSRVFRLRGQDGDHVTVRVSGGSKGWLVVGIVITPIGGMVTLVGVALGLLASASGSAGGSSCQSSSCIQYDGDTGHLATVGWVTALLGAAVTVGGILLIANNAKAGVAVDLTGAQAARVQGDAWAHVPTWHDSAAAEKAAPPVFGGSLWTGKF